MKKKNFLSLVMAFVLLLTLTACGGASKNEMAMDYAPGAAPMENGMLTTDTAGSTASVALPEDRKLNRRRTP